MSALDHVIVPRDAQSRGRWCGVVTPRLDAPLQAFCFPHAGGAASSQRGWDHAFGGRAEVVAIELPGRGARWGEPASHDLSALATAAAEEVRAVADRPFALVGTSMGGLLAYEVARRLERDGRAEPRGLMVCGARPPHLAPVRQLHVLPDEALHEQLARLGGIPAEVSAERDLLQLLLPAIRADLTAAETHVAPLRRRLSCPLVVIVGRDDPLVPLAIAAAWAHHAVSFRLMTVPGGHFIPSGTAARAARALMLALAPFDSRGVRCL